MNAEQRADVALVLRVARAVLAQKGWVQRMGAADAQGMPAALHGPYAVRFCAVGAISLAAPGGDRGAFAATRLALFEDIYRAEPRWDSVVDWNDAPGRTREEVISAFDRTIARLESEAVA